MIAGRRRDLIPPSIRVRQTGRRRSSTKCATRPRATSISTSLSGKASSRPRHASADRMLGRWACIFFVLPARISGGVLNAEQPEALIYEQDLNVDTPAGVETLFGRIHSAAERVCSETDPLARVAASKCARKAEAGTIEKLNLPLLTAYYRMKNGGRTGMFTANR
jgi:UrcA family protein